MKMHVFKIRLYVENLGHVSIHFSPKINGLYPEFNKKKIIVGAVLDVEGGASNSQLG